VSQWIVDASLALGWFLKDEQDRAYNLSVLAGLDRNDALVPFLWWYEVSNGLLMAHRRNRLSMQDMNEILASLRALPILIDPPDPAAVTGLPALAAQHNLTVYDAAYLDLALRSGAPIATKDNALKRAMAASGVSPVTP
jgi:predicted nucleic acid-binding protein